MATNLKSWMEEEPTLENAKNTITPVFKQTPEFQIDQLSVYHKDQEWWLKSYYSRFPPGELFEAWTLSATSKNVSNSKYDSIYVSDHRRPGFVIIVHMPYQVDQECWISILEVVRGG